MLIQARQRLSTSVGILAAGKAFAPLAALRIARRWNQTGQKFAGSPDIAKVFLPAHTHILWGLVVLAYADAIVRLIRNRVSGLPRAVKVISCALLGYLALGFKVAFTRADAPELLRFHPQIASLPWVGSSLVMQARLIFVLLAAFAVVAVAYVYLVPSSRHPTDNGIALHPQNSNSGKVNRFMQNVLGISMTS